jgi:hypothetical protein
MDYKELQQYANRLMNERNNTPIPYFEGYSPNEMDKILYSTFDDGSPLVLQKLSDEDYAKIPLLNMVKYLAGLVDKAGEIKLTNKGFLPTKIVSELYSQGYIKERSIEMGFQKLYKETDSISVNLSHILINLTGLIKKRNGKISLTKSAKALLGNNEKLFRLVLLTFTSRFNWAYYDGYEQHYIGQLGFGLSLIFLSKYGQERRLDTFYAEKYFKAFPSLLESLEPSYDTVESYGARCYSLRTFKRFLLFFGLITMEEEGERLDTVQYVSKTEIFDKLIKCLPHKVMKN